MVYDNDEFRAWVQSHLNHDPADLSLKFHGRLPWVEEAIMQVKCRRKTRKKLEKELENPRFYFPTTLSAEQCTGDRLADFHASLIKNGDSVLDLTCGLGIDSLHFAEKAKSVTSIDRNPDLCEALSHNASALGLDNITVVTADCSEFLNDSTSEYDVIFIDPARRGMEGERLFGLHDCSPDVIDLLPLIRKHCRKLIVKASPMLDLTQITRELPDACDIYVTGNDNECKEVVIVIDFEKKTESEPTIHALSTSHDFAFKRSDELNADIQFSDPPSAGYLYEPNPEIMKAAPFKLLSQLFAINKISPNTHLYWSEHQATDFPGNVLKIIKTIDYASSNIKRFAKEFPEIRVAARNFGITADQLRKKLKVKDGGELRLFAITTASDKKIMIVAAKS
ncbi:MAG: class I SAM-dependent methyltransferase [Lachnospiraceae bacterium]|nr:class I SAM-dependent methyltransferase [Lachnospiraceae bacterium]